MNLLRCLCTYSLFRMVIAAFVLLQPMALLCAAENSRPNVLLVITDDQGYGDFSLHGNPHLQTPVFDKLARQGVQFERYFVSPLCAPTRASLLTGRYWLRGGVWGVTHSKEALRPEEITIAEALKAAGYRTGIFGKWHNGEQYPYTPPGQGFDEFFGFHNGHWNNYFDTELLRGAGFVKTRGYVADVLADAAIAFIEQNKSRPFFCYVPFNTPHSPFQVPDKYFDRFKKMGLDDTLSSVYGMCENLDENLGRLLATLERLGLRENTIVLFMTDNGANTDRFNAGMKGRKGSVHEGGSRVPLIIQWPARFKTPRVVSQIAAHVDVLPTLLDLCGVTVSNGFPLDGRSLRPLLEGNTNGWPERILFTHQTRALQTPAKFPGAARSQRYRLVNEGRGYELYDMVADPGQSSNIAAANPDVVRQLSATYEAWFADVSKRGFERFPLPVGYEQENPVSLHAPQAFYEGGISFFGKNGFANDWLTGWTNVSGQVWWDVEVVKSGNYEVALRYLCPEADAGSKLRVSVGTASVEVTVPGTPIKEISLPHRVREANTYVNMEWATLPLGTMKLEQGRHKLTVQSLTRPGTQVMDLKSAVLRRID
jgi:arylsulfatase A-like enzyme